MRLLYENAAHPRDTCHLRRRAGYRKVSNVSLPLSELLFLLLERARERWTTEQLQDRKCLQLEDVPATKKRYTRATYVLPHELQLLIIRRTTTAAVGSASFQ